MPSVRPCLWFDDKAEEAARFYTELFPDGKLGTISRYGAEGFDVHGRPAGSVMTVDFEIMGMRVTALNGGPHFTFDEAISFEVICDGQEEVDHYWNALIADGGAESMCGWLKDKFGLSWQIVPRQLAELASDPDRDAAGRAMNAMLKMRKIDVAALQRAFAGESQ